MYTWKQRNGSKATYSELIEIFERADYKSYVEELKRIAEIYSDSEGEDSNGSGEEQPKTYPTLHKAQAFSHDQLSPKSAEVFVMVEKEILPSGKGWLKLLNTLVMENKIKINRGFCL